MPIIPIEGSLDPIDSIEVSHPPRLPISWVDAAFLPPRPRDCGHPAARLIGETGEMKEVRMTRHVRTTTLLTVLTLGSGLEVLGDAGPRPGAIREEQLRRLAL